MGTIIYNLQKFKKQFAKLLIKLDFEASNMLLKGIALLGVITLSYNLYLQYNKGVDNIALIVEEESKLEKLLQESEQLDRDLNYFGSVEYQKIYVRDSQNLAEPGEQLYSVIRDEELDIQFYEKNEDPIVYDNNVFWWKKLILGN